MTAARDPRDLDAAFGGTALHKTDGAPTIYLTRSEAELRRRLAAVAHAYGWDVSEEVVIPGWGRIDLVLEDDKTHLIELKIDLTKPARIRRAFQQADGYGRWWCANKSRAVDVYLVGYEMNWTTITSVADAYYTVLPRSISGLLNFFEAGGTDVGLKFRRARAMRRSDRAAEVSQLYTRALERLIANTPEPKPTQEAAEAGVLTEGAAGGAA